MNSRRLLADHGRVSLCTLPTPIEKLPRLQKDLGRVNILAKRDDVMELAMGGNKVRKLEFLMADAIEKGCDVLITTGDLHSNHARLTAAAARRLGLDVVLALKGKKPDSSRGNLLLDELLHADIRYYDVERAEIPSIMDEIRRDEERKGRKPYLIPRGGASPVGVLGYVHAVFELKRQLQAARTKIDYIVFPTGTGATQAGLLLGAKLAKLRSKIIGISAGRSAGEIGSDVTTLVQDTSQILGVDASVSSADVAINDEYTCGGYGVVTSDVLDLIRYVAKLEGLLLDPVYTGKGMLGLVGLARKGFFEEGSNILFIHTGGLPIIFSHYRPS